MAKQLVESVPLQGVVGFQGIENSYSDLACRQIIEETGLQADEILPLEVSNNVKNALLSGRIQYGVVALQNTVGGIVKETNEIFLDDKWHILHKYILEIHHCIFVRSAEQDLQAIEHVASHEQALQQCRSTIDALFGEQVDRVEARDTAITARLLANGNYPENTAVICSREAGLSAGLHLVREDAQDFHGNRTEFALIALKEASESAATATGLIRWLLSSESVFKSAVKYLFLAVILLAFPLHYLSERFLPADYQLSFAEVLMSLVAVALSGYSLIMSYRKKKSLELITGYWIYMDKVKSGEGDENQNYNIPRAVIIYCVENELRVQGWLCKEEPEFYFQDVGVFHTSPFSTKGSIIYKYTNYLHENSLNFNGIVELEWSKPSPSSIIRMLSGNYYGFLTNSRGGLLFNRVSKETFLQHCPIPEVVGQIESKGALCVN